MFAGLYSWWADHSKSEDDPGFWNLTSTIVTTAAVPHLAHIHDRRPATLPPELWADWMNPDILGDDTFIEYAMNASAAVAEELNEYPTLPLKDDGLPAVPIPAE
jgi:putative SOS response-associated peptidase YedK